MHIKKHTYRICISLIVSVLALAIILQFVEINNIKILFQANWLWLLLGFFSYILNYIFRTLRFNVLLNANNIAFKDLFGVTVLYGMLNFLMPSKSGEFSYLFLANRYLKTSLSEGAATLITARFFDFTTATLFLPVILIVFWQNLSIWALYSLTAFCVIVAIAAALFILLVNKQQVVNPGEKRKNKLDIKYYWKRLIYALQGIYSRGRYTKTFLLTIFIWTTIYLNYYCITVGLGIDVTIFQMIVVSIIMTPLTILPLQGVANLGSHELGWTTALALFGYNAETALTIAVGSHVVLLIFVLLLGGGGMIILKTRSRKSSNVGK